MGRGKYTLLCSTCSSDSHSVVSSAAVENWNTFPEKVTAKDATTWAKGEERADGVGRSSLGKGLEWRQIFIYFIPLPTWLFFLLWNGIWCQGIIPKNGDLLERNSCLLSLCLAQPSSFSFVHTEGAPNIHGWVNWLILHIFSELFIDPSCFAWDKWTHSVSPRNVCCSEIPGMVWIFLGVWGYFLRNCVLFSFRWHFELTTSVILKIFCARHSLEELVITCSDSQS